MPIHRAKMHLLGPFSLFRDDNCRVEIPSKKGIALLAMLAMSPTGARSRLWLRSMLWGTRESAQAQASLRKELSTLSKLLTDAGLNGLLICGSQRIELNRSALWIDAAQINIDELHTTNDVFLEGIDLPGCEEFEDWLREERTHFDTLRTLSKSTFPHTHLDAHPPTSPEVPLKPSVAVLPFSIIDLQSHENTLLGTGIAEEIGQTLAQFPHLFVVASTGAAALIERGCTAREVAVQLGVQYLVAGLVQRSHEALRVNVELLDGTTAEKRWSKTFSGSIHKLFELQEEIATEVAPQIWTNIDMAERHKGLSAPLRSNDGYQLYWRVNALMRQWNEAALTEASGLAEQLIAQAPNNSWAFAIAGFTHGLCFANGWTKDPPKTRLIAAASYQRALTLDQDNVEVLGYAAGTLVSIGGDLVVADSLICRAIEMFPGYQATQFWGGWVDIASGNMARACERFQLALRINPASGVRPYVLTGIGLARLGLGDLDAAYAGLFEAYIHLPLYPLTAAGLCISAAMKGEVAVATQVAIRLRDMGGIERAAAIFRDPNHREMLRAGFKMAEAHIVTE